MAEADLRLILRTIADTSGAEKTSAALRRVQQDTAKTTSTTQQAAAAVIKWVGALALVDRALTAAVDVYRASIDAHRENERVTRATAAAYGASAQQFTRFAESLSTSTGFTSQAILEAALSARTLSTNYGLTIQQTQQLIKASADLARVRGIGVAEAFERVQSAIRGEAEASEYLGLTLNDTFIKNNALNGSVRATFERMTDAQKAQIRYSELLRQTANFAGLAADSTNSLDGSMLRAESSANKLSISIGKLTAPATIAALQKLAGAAEELNRSLQPGDIRGELLRGGLGNIQGLPGQVVAARRDAETRARDAAIQAELELQQDALQKTAQLQRRPATGVWVTQAANALRAGERQMAPLPPGGVLAEMAFLDQRDAAVRDLLIAQREEVALKEQLTRMEREQGDMAQRRLQYELATIAAQQRALPAQQALQDTERAVERARLVLGIRGTSIEERRAARGTIREAERNILPSQRLAAFDAETGVIGAQRGASAFDLAARVTQIGVEQAISRQETLINVAAARVDQQQQVLGQIMQQAISDGFLKRPPTQITLQVLGPDGQVTYEELIEAADQAGMPPVVRVSGVRR